MDALQLRIQAFDVRIPYQFLVLGDASLYMRAHCDKWGCG